MKELRFVVVASGERLDRLDYSLREADAEAKRRRAVGWDARVYTLREWSVMAAASAVVLKRHALDEAKRDLDTALDALDKALEEAQR